MTKHEETEFTPCEHCTARFKELEEDLWRCRMEVEKHRELIRRLRRENTKLRRQARIDSLTGLPNRLWFFKELKSEVARAHRRGVDLHVVVFDLDLFKQVNDTYGHPVGDKVLAKTGKILRETLRTEDFCGRIGGEEFAILLPYTAPHEAVAMMGRLREEVESNLHISIPGKVVRVTASFGLSKLRKKEGVKAFFARVDRALYTAKREGRNRVVHHE